MTLSKWLSSLVLSDSWVLLRQIPISFLGWTTQRDSLCITVITVIILWMSLVGNFPEYQIFSRTFFGNSSSFGLTFRFCGHSNFILCWVDDCDDHHHPFGLAKPWDRTRTRTRQTQVNPGTYFLKLLTFPLLPHNQVWRVPHLSFKGFLSFKFQEVFFLFEGCSSFFEEEFMVQVK